MAPLVDYRYDSTANRVGVTEASGDRVTWTYDATYQLTRERRSGVNGYDVTHVYDPAGNRTLKLDGGSRTTSVYNGANQLVWSQDGSGRTTITYDADGNLTREVKPSGQITTSVWDAESMNSAVLLPDTTRVTYTYNADHLRVRKDTASGTRKYVFDLQNPFTETDGSDVTQAVYVVEPQTYGNIVSQRQLVGGIWNSVYYHFDALGSTGSLSDGMSVVTDTYTYTAFGETKASTGTTTNVYTWVGELGYFRDVETGSYNLRERPYEPDKARMKNPDPLGLEVDPNEYRIVGNNPVNAVDPSGMQEIINPFANVTPLGGGPTFAEDDATIAKIRMRCRKSCTSGGRNEGAPPGFGLGEYPEPSPIPLPPQPLVPPTKDPQIERARLAEIYFRLLAILDGSVLSGSILDYDRFVNRFLKEFGPDTSLDQLLSILADVSRPGGLRFQSPGEQEPAGPSRGDLEGLLDEIKALRTACARPLPGGNVDFYDCHTGEIITLPEPTTGSVPDAPEPPYSGISPYPGSPEAIAAARKQWIDSLCSNPWGNAYLTFTCFQAALCTVYGGNTPGRPRGMGSFRPNGPRGRKSGGSGGGGRSRNRRRLPPSIGIVPDPSFTPKRGGSLTNGERSDIQRIANKYKTTIYVVGSRAEPKGGWNIYTNRPVGKGSMMRSDIDFKIDAQIPKVDELIAELRAVGNGAGRADKKYNINNESVRLPFIKISPQQ